MILVCACLLFSACANEEIVVKDGVDEYMPETVETETEMKITNAAGITLFSWQVPTKEYAQKYADEIKNCNFEYVEFCVLWNEIEPEQGVFKWNYLNTILDVFVGKGIRLSLSVLFWSERLDWKDVLDYQCTADGEVYRYDDTRGSFLSLNSTSNLEIVVNTVKNFAAHCADRYGDNIVSWAVRIDCFAKTEYSSLVDLDYSESAIQAFREYIEAKYLAIELFNYKFSTKYASFDELFATDYETLTQRYQYDWKLFKQQTLINFSNIYTEIFKIADSRIPVVLHLSSFWDTSASFYRGVFDPYTVAKASNVDIIQVSDAAHWPHDFSVDLIKSLCDKYLFMETDGSWQGEDVYSEYLRQVAVSAQSGVDGVQTINWELGDMVEYGPMYLSKYSELLKNAEMRFEADLTDVIFVNTVDFLLKQPPQDMNDLYYYAYKNMTGLTGRKVRFISDTQILDDPTVLDGIKKIHLGELAEIIHINDEVGRLFAERDIILVDDRNAQPNFINEYGVPLDNDIQEKLRAKLKDS